MRRFIKIMTVLLAWAAPAAAQNEQGPVQKRQGGRPTDLNAYSLQFWPLNSLDKGQIVSTTTPYGTLTCRSTGRGPRQCTLR